ncbi:hypothetical protein SanaruYs_31430 [Chryseotalea sanaruensis]|uniref:Glycosyltransferase RgtA/B/C/D-like domain-containing protein n=1 Tax=Chryseotalea sanaruensis TaxID=2482724 RepID=A0A401UDE9_9BACT|nr:hypothetical protein [Chryseotalea sanaruensis]GCC52903.1 hypothetical protein SanaruYs_31430 [Chryseotalea sanaruensis]
MKKANAAIKPFYLPALFLHVIAGISLGLLYVHYYGESDTLIYFQEGLKLNELLFLDVKGYLNFLWSNAGDDTFLQTLVYTDKRALFMVKISSLVLLCSLNNYWIASIYFSVISFLASWQISNLLNYYFPSKRNAIIFSFLFIPSVVFWSSGVVKESVALASLFCIVSNFIRLYKDGKLVWWQWLMMIICIWLLYNLKYYYLAVVIPVIITSLVVKRIITYWPKCLFIQELLLWLAIFCTFSLLVTQLHPNFYPSRFLSVIYNNYLAFIANSAPEDVMHFQYLSENWINVTLLSPWAFVSGLFRPFIWESTNALQTIAAIENTCFLVLTISSLHGLKTLAKHPDRILIFATLIYCFVLSVFLTLSTPNFGTLIRYRVGFLPFFIFLTASSSPIFNLIINLLSSIRQKLVGNKP